MRLYNKSIWKVSATTAVTFVLPVAVASPPQIQGGDCFLTKDADSTWQACLQQDAVTVIGKLAPHQHMMQHPILTTPFGSNFTHQNYITVGIATTVIILTDSTPNCEQNLQINGKLQAIDMGGAVGSKNSYSGWAMWVKNLVCL